MKFSLFDMRLQDKEKFKSILRSIVHVLKQVQAEILVIILICVSGCYAKQLLCGGEHSAIQSVDEGEATIETYPWLGLLLYPIGPNILDSEPITKTTVVQITIQLVLATALEVDKYPKHDFRKSSRVILGHNCTVGPFIKVLEYTFHPDFANHYYSSLALIQIDPLVKQELMPICAPPRYFNVSDIYAMTVSHDCTESKMLSVYKMMYVHEDDCRDYYRRANLDLQSMWPKHVSCARSTSGGDCLWRSGTVLVTKLNGVWHLLGVGVYGPGCEAPARFLDYDSHIHWVRDSINNIGRTTVTRINKASVILRRTITTLGRYGPCDLEETENNFYTDYTQVRPRTVGEARGYLVINLTLFGRIEYNCIALRAWYRTNESLGVNSPELKEVRYKISCYGAPIKSVEAKRVLYWTNQRRTKPTMSWARTWYKRPWKIPDGPYPYTNSNAYPRYPARPPVLGSIH